MAWLNRWRRKPGPVHTQEPAEAEFEAGPAAPGAPDRREQLLSLFDTRGHGLEIGAGFNPLLPKSEGYDIKVLDHASQEDLRHKYEGSGVDLARIEPVDYVSSGGSLIATIGREACFDYIVGSHVIEHSVDLLGLLIDCQRLLKAGGVVALAVPDKRFSFDVLRPVSSTGDVLQAHVEGRTRHSLGALFDEVAYNSLRGGALAWPPDAGGPLAFAGSLEAAYDIFEKSRREGTFHDIHAWQFTPSSFRLIVSDLHAVGYLGLREKAFLTAPQEFFVALSSDGAGPDAGRLTLAQRAIAESQAIRVETGD
jgi:SAM-dependent methyltransferase